MRQTVIDWGDLRLWNVQTNSINQEQVFDPSGTDIMYSKITISVTGHIREGAATSGIRSSWVDYGDDADLPPDFTAQNSSLTTVANNWRSRLSFKNSFRMWIGCDDSGNGGTLHLFVSPYTSKDQGGVKASHSGSYGTEWFDCNAGPKCLNFNQETNFSAHAFRVSMTFELCVPWCETADDSTKILLNRWSVSDQIDENLFTTRTYHGTLKVANPYINPNLLREIVLPPLAQGMRRKDMEFNVADDGRSMQYRIVDREAAFACPAPARTWNITHSESVGIGRPLIQTTLHISLTGDRDVSKKDLILLANRIAEEKITGLSLANAGDKSNVVLIDDMTVVDYTSNDAPVRIDFRIQATRARDDGLDFNGAAGDIGKDLTGADFPIAGYDANLSPDPGHEGRVPFAGAVIAYMRTVCYQMSNNYVREGIPPDPEESAGVGTYPDGMPEVTVRSVPAGSVTVPDWISTQFKTAVYTHYQVDSVWESSDGRVVLPIAQSSAAYSAGTDTIAVCKLTTGWTKRIIRVEAARLGEPPIIQTPQNVYTLGSGGSTMTLTRLSTRVSPSTPEKTPDGQDLWTVRAEFVYACSRPPAIGEDLPIGIDPSFTGPKSNLAAAALNTFNESSIIS